jgi:release factor glutamine methyltransferase
MAALVAATSALAEAGCDTPRLDAELLLAHALNVDRAELVLRPHTPAPKLFDELVARRAEREPVAYIVGRKGFRHIELEVDRRVLIPRPETETLVEAALELLAPGARVHDVGTGSGCVALALKQERPELSVSGSDASEGAVAVARANAARLGLDVSFALARGLPSGRYDLVVANLPYVREDEWAGLEPELTRYEPREALVAGADGLDAIRDVVAGAPAGTRLALEHAPAQAAAVRDLLRDAHTLNDLAGRERVTVGFAP